MRTDFAAAMRRALEETRAGNPSRATGTIQSALTGGAAPEARSRASLRSVVDQLSRLRARQPESDAPPEIPPGARFEARQHSGPNGARGYRLYIPAGPGAPQGLILMLHGCTQTPEDFARGTAMNAVAERHGLIVAYPGQTRGHNAASCWNWFRPGDQRRGAGEPAILADLAREVAAEFGVPGGRVFAAGLSAGGAMAAVLGHACPDLFSAVGVHSGLAPGSAHDVPSALAAMRGETGGGRPPAARTIILHGSADATVHPLNARHLFGAADGVGERGTTAGRGWRRLAARDARGRPVRECWLIEGAGHAWSGGDPSGSHTDPAGPDASAEMARFFLDF